MDPPGRHRRRPGAVCPPARQPLTACLARGFGLTGADRDERGRCRAARFRGGGQSAAGGPGRGHGRRGWLVGVGLSAEQVRDYYEGFCNATLWPLYHDVISAPQFERRWWEAYVAVNRSFAAAAAAEAAPGATVWVHDYQLQLVPRMLREQRADVRIGFFNHIPFPGYEIFAH